MAAAYKTVELDECECCLGAQPDSSSPHPTVLRGVATQHREVQDCPSPAFQSLFPRIIVRSGGVASGFTHVEPKAEEKRLDLYRVTKTPGAGMNTPSAKTSTVVKQVSPSWTSLVEDDCFILDTGDKMIIWQGKKASPIEKAKAAQVAHDMTLSRQCSTEVVGTWQQRSEQAYFTWTDISSYFSVRISSPNRLSLVRRSAVLGCLARQPDSRFFCSAYS